MRLRQNWSAEASLEPIDEIIQTVLISGDSPKKDVWILKQNFPLRIVLLYAILAGAYIVFSDWLIFSLGGAPTLVEKLSIYKGLAFIVLTSTLLYILMSNAWNKRSQMERELSQTEAHYRQLFISNPHPMWVYDLETLAFLDVNDAAVAHYGYSREEFLNMTIKDIRPAEDIPRLLENIAQVGEGLDRAGVWRHVKKDGSIIDVEITSHVVEFGQRRAEMVLINDVTERRRAEQALRESEEKFRTVFETANVGKSITSPDGVLFVNKAFAEMLGYTQEELAHTTWQMLTPEEDVEEAEALLAPLLSGEKDSVRFNKRYIHKNGSYIWGDVNVAIRRDVEGKPLHFITTVVDITERTLAEQALRESEARYLNILNVAPVGIAVHQKGKIVFANPAGMRLIGAASPDELVGRDIRTIIHPDHLETAMNRIQRMLAGEQGLYPVEDKYVRLDGQVIDVEVMATRLSYQGEPAVQVIVTDITERKRAERQLNEQIAELRRWHTAMLGREGRILELKREVNALLRQISQPPRYRSAEEEIA